MIDVKHKRYYHENCLKIPILNFINNTIGIYCLEYKKEGMIYIKNVSIKIKFIRYNQDKIKNNDKEINIKNSERLDLLVRIIKEELIKAYEEFVVKIIQIYYNDNYEKYEAIKEEIITDLVCI